MLQSPKLARLLVVCLCVFSLAGEALAQTKPTVPAPVVDGAPVNETRAEMLTRFGLTTDPGSDPDEKTIHIRFGKRWRIQKYARKDANFQDMAPGWVRPFGWVNAKREIYQMDAETIWVFEPIAETVDGRLAPADAAAEAISPRRRTISKAREGEVKRYLEIMRPDFFELKPADSGLTLQFRDSSKGLPESGSWRNSMAVADMNEDGLADLILPSQRGGGATIPAIFLGDGKGGWEGWDLASWPYSLNYGSVDAADFNRDGHQDLLFGMHLTGVAVMLGDGKGNFTDASPPGAFATRKALARDVDGDGHMDIVAISEGPGAAEIKQPGRTSIDSSNLRAWLNDGKAKAWREVAVAPRDYQVGGDWLAVGDFTGDKRLDVAGSSIYYNAPDVLYLSKKPSKEEISWTPFGRGWLPFYSTYTALTSGKFGAKDREEVIFTYVRNWPKRLAVGLVENPELESVVGLERVSWTSAGPKRSSVVRWSGTRAVWGIASGDFDSDGNLDLVYSRVQPRAYEFLLGDGKGGFKRAVAEGIDVPTNIVYDIKVADVNGDKRPDVLLMYESDGGIMATGAKNGSVKVYLNQGARKK